MTATTLLGITIYVKRNIYVATHNGWRAKFGQFGGDCPNFGQNTGAETFRYVSEIFRILAET
jgi:hypothetical protein